MSAMKSIAETDEFREDEERSHNGYASSETEEDHLLGNGMSKGRTTTPGLGSTRRQKKEKTAKDIFMTFGTFNRYTLEASMRSESRRRLNVAFGILLVICLVLLSGIVGTIYYKRVYVPAKKAKSLKHAIHAHAEAARKRVEMCRGIDWQTACDRLSGAGARRNLQNAPDEPASSPYTEFEQLILDSDDPTVTYDEFCLRVYRLEMFGSVTFPYHSSQLLKAGGNQSMALFIQHGAMRNSEEYFCSFKKLMYEQNYRDFDDILVISPDFNYEHDTFVHPNDAFWNSTKPWGDWRVGAESDPDCCGRTGATVSSFDVLDHMLTMLTSKKLFPNMRKISYVGHSAGGQMVQRYAVMSTLAALWDIDDDLDLTFIIANPSSYTYLDNRRWHYNCGDCTCTDLNCTCDAACSSISSLGHPYSGGAGQYFPCYERNYNQWPYGIGSFSDHRGRRIPYALRQGYLGAERAVRVYPKLHVVYLVGQNDTCNDGLPVCDASCWKRENYSEDEWPCFRNQMDTRCPAMLQGPFRRARGHQYMLYLEDLYGKPIHNLYEVPGVGHNASGMFGSPIGLRELFGHGEPHSVQ